MGAGVIPLAVNNDEVWFLFQKTFTGRKVGHLIDFGGGLGKTEDHRDTAIREFVEETETMYLEDDISLARRTEERINRQINQVARLFEQTLSNYPDWWRRRLTANPEKPKDWITYFIQFPYRDVAGMNHAWKTDTSGRFKKRRELVWVSSDQLLDVYKHSPENLWKRVRQLQDADMLIGEIRGELVGL